MNVSENAERSIPMQSSIRVYVDHSEFPGALVENALTAYPCAFTRRYNTCGFRDSEDG